MAEWPSGTVTFLFTDLEGSTQRWQQYPTAMGPALARHNRLLRDAISAHGGVVFKTVGDAVCAAFSTAPAAVAASLTAQRALYAEPWGSTGPLRARMALHTGQAEAQEGDYLGGPLNRVARLLALGHGGQILLSGPTADLVHDYLPPGVSLTDLGTHRLKDVQRPEHVFQLVAPDLPWEFEPLGSGSPTQAGRQMLPSSVEQATIAPTRRVPLVSVAVAAVVLCAAALVTVIATQIASGDADRESTPPSSTVIAASTVVMSPTPSSVATSPPLVVAASPSTGLQSGVGQVVYSLNTGQPGSGRLYRVAAQEGASPEDLSTALDALSPGGQDYWVSVSPDGSQLLFGTERFDPECLGWPCLVVAPADLSRTELVRADGKVVHPSDPGVIAGDQIVIPSGDGPHESDLWAITREDGRWSEPLLLTADSPYAYHAEPVLSVDGTRVVFECGNRPYGEAGTAVCEVAADGTNFWVVLTPADGPDGLPTDGALRRPTYASDGAVLFEATWEDGVWRLPVGSTIPLRVGPGVANDGSPCVLPDGRIATLWMGRPNSDGKRELKVMEADESQHFVLISGLDIARISCGA